MNIRNIVAALIFLAAPPPVVAQDNNEDSESAAPQPEDRLKILGGQLLQELFTRATTKKPKTPPDRPSDAANETYEEPVAIPSPEPATETDVYEVNEDAAEAIETEMPGTPAEPFLRSQSRTKQPTLTRPQ